MKGAKILLAGLVGGVAMFFWGYVSHELLPVGEMGVRPLPSENMFVPAMKISLKERGWYRFPPMDPKDKSEAAMKAWEEKAKAGPVGVLIYDPTGMPPMGTLLGVEFISNVLAALLLAVIISGVNAGKLGGTIVGAGMGIFAWLSISVSYWNWDRFPTEFTMSEMLQQMVGGGVTGLAAAWILTRGRTSKPPPI